MPLPHLERIDRFTFLSAIGLLLIVTIPLIIWPTQGALWVAHARSFMTDQLGGLYLLLGLASVLFMLYVIFSDIGNIHLGEVGERPEFATGSWAAMLFCGGIGASILYWAPLEWVYYYQNPPFQVEPASDEAVRWAATYGIFHWGFIAWSIYLIPAIPISYFFYVRKNPVLKISTALMPVIGESRANSTLGKLIDVLFIFGLLGGGATTLGLAAPLITEGLSNLTGAPKTIGVQIGVLLVCTALFAYSAYAGLSKGIKLLSNFNFWGALALLAFIFIVGPTVFMFETGLDAFGRMLTNFFSMATWTEPFGGLAQFNNTHFPQDWTIFYWAWWLVFAPSMGLFIARISRGRTIKQMIVGSIFFGSMGCFVFFMVFGNYGLYLQLSGDLDMVGILNEQGPTAAIFAMLETLPLSTLVIAVFTLLAIVFTATTFDSISYILASVVQSDIGEEPMRWNRLFWAFALSFMPATLLFLGGLNTLQTAAIVGGLPLLLIAVMLAWSAVSAARIDLMHHPEYQDPVINIEELPDISPWSDEGIALKRFETSRDKATEAAQAQRDALDALMAFKAECNQDVDSQLTEAQEKTLAKLEADVLAAAENKAEATRRSQTAWSDFMQANVERDAKLKEQ
ncbi:BCCT family transporter [Thalassotalea ponticola]|uniref:BCCT family transporter n=1 Tax=Thalassotalea ponticola TaxID=1523392 RepID=UPI0025B44DFA|nr:BCCT family transporter [Thalassotalea ponticola]MDN3653839.1 BCCT family transporter [Thalassotalea ponticola]